MRAIGYLVALAALCAALGSQVADVVVAAKNPATAKPPTALPKGVGVAAAAAAGPAVAVTVKTIVHTTLNKVLGKAAAPAAPAAQAAQPGPAAPEKNKKSRTAMSAGHHQAAARRLPGEDAAAGSGGGGGAHGLLTPSSSGEHGVHADAPAAAPGLLSVASPVGSGPTGTGSGGGGGPAGSGRDVGLEGEAGAAGATDNATLAVTRSSPSNHPFVKQGAYPFVVTVQKVCGGCHTRHYCAGALLAAQWVVSLPQCAETHPGEGLVVRAGDAFIWPGDHTPTQKVMEVVWHEATTSTEDYPKYDAVLMRLENPFALNENLNTISLAPTSPEPGAGGAVSLLGWAPPGHVQQVELNLTRGSLRPPEECWKIAPQEVLPADTLCVQPVEPLLERCPYDVGDPVFVESEPPQLVGLLMRWYQPCAASRPVAALKMAGLYSWIYDKISGPSTQRPVRPTEEATTLPPLLTFPPPVIPPFTMLPVTLPPVTWPSPPYPTPQTPPQQPPPTPPAPPATTTTTTTTTTTPPPWTHHYPGPVTASSPTGSVTSAPSVTSSPPRPGGQGGGATHVRPMTVSSSSASGALSNTTSTSDAALLPGHMESSLSYSLGTAGVEPAKPALSNSVSVGWANCRDVGGALGMSYALAYSFISEGTASAASTVNATCLDVNAVQSQGWSISTSGGSAPVNVRAFIMEHLASIPGLPRQPSLKYL